MSDIAAKIAKIVAKAEGTSSEGEAAVLMAKAKQLLEKHNLTLAECTFAESLEIDPVAITDHFVHFTTGAYYMRGLMFALARYYGAEAISIRRGHRFTMDIIGRQSSRDTVLAVLPLVRRQIKAAAKALYNQRGAKSHSSAETMIGNALTSRIKRMTYVRRDREAESAAYDKYLPMVKSEIDNVVEQSYGNAKEAKTKAKTVTYGAIVAANNITFTQDVAKTNALQIGAQ